MTWVRIDDRYWTNRKVRKAWRLEGRTVGLHVMALAYCSMNETDGVIDEEFVNALMPNPRDRKQVLDVLLDVGLWHASPEDGFWVINDYLEFNPSKAELTERRRRDSERKRNRNPRGLPADSERNPDRFHEDSNGIPSDPSRARGGAPTAHPIPAHTREHH